MAIHTLVYKMQQAVMETLLMSQVKPPRLDIEVGRFNDQPRLINVAHAYDHSFLVGFCLPAYITDNDTITISTLHELSINRLSPLSIYVSAFIRLLTAPDSCPPCTIPVHDISKRCLYQ